MKKKYYYRVTDENGTVIFDHQSDYATRLFDLLKKESHDPDSGMEYSSFYFGKHETNMSEQVLYRLSCGERI